MAQIASIKPQDQAPRISQLLPTVKCSNCCQPVALAELGDHVCPPQPPPSLLSLQKPPMSPKSATSLLPQRLQNLVSRSGTPPQIPPKASLDRLRPSEEERIPARSPSQRDPFQRLPPSVNIMGTPKKTSVALPPNPRPSQAAPPTSILVNRGSPPIQSAPERIPTPARNGTPPVLERIRTPSNPGPISPTRGAPLPNPFGDAGPQPQPVVGRPRAASLARREKPPPPPQQPPPPTPSLPSLSVGSSPTFPPNIQARPSFERTRTPSANSASRPSFDRPRPSLDPPRPSLDGRPSLDAQRPSMERNPPSSPASASAAGSVARPPRRSSIAPLPAPGTVPFPSSSVPVPVPPVSMRQQPPPPIALPKSPVPEIERGIDTKTGGEAGMAGVGRRGFAAAARAAMFATSLPHQHGPMMPSGDGRRANAPQYLNINATMGHVMRAAMTPPLSPNSGHTSSPVSPFPVSPVSIGSTTPTNGQYPNLPSPHDASFRQPQAPSPNQKAFPLSSSPANVRIASPSRTPSPSIPNPFERRLSGETVTQSPMPGLNVRLPILDILSPDNKHDAGNESDEESVYTTHTAEPRKGDGAPMSPSMDSDVGLAYADDSDDDTPVVMPLDLRNSNTNMGTNKVKFPSLPSPDRTRSSGPSRQTSAASSRSALSSRSAATYTAGPSRSRSASATTQSTARSVGALERAMETLIEEGASVSVLASGSVLASIAGPSTSRGAGGKPSRSNTVPGPASPEQKPPKLPTRSHTSPSHPHVHSERVGITAEVARIRNRGPEKKKDRTCARCETKIEDGRWIRMDGGSVLCERCWKNMYLPKCRRCNLPIEKQAVSSRDGQLKGKYHRDCFNCHTCQKPFPDKEFYVFDGKPFCAYHYHEANDSLCAASSCGQPIEGPCAVTHSGRRFHPEHLLCEFEDGCGEKLAEYWEVDGQMFCERHAGVCGSRDGGSTRGDDPSDDLVESGKLADEGRAMRRMTRFIDLGAGEDEDVDIR